MNKLESPAGVPVQRMVRRRLIVDFFKLGSISRWDVCDKGGWLTESDLRLYQEEPDQKLWALAFERAEQRGELNLMREYVDAEMPNDPSSATRPTGRYDCKPRRHAGLDAMRGCVARGGLAPGPGYENRSNAA